MASYRLAGWVSLLVGCSPSPPAHPSPFLIRPFVEDVHTTALFDHDATPGASRRNSPLAFWGGRTFGHGGHPGYDWPLGRGTPVLAAADGVVLHAGAEDPFHCFITGRTVSDQRVVKLLHQRPDDHRLMTVYAHLNTVDVTIGQTVTAGTPIGTAGATGCATGVHLHFETWRWFQDDPIRARRVDPYGWSSPDPDPWTVADEGGESVLLWLPSQAPAIYRDAVLRSRQIATDVPVGLFELRSVSGQGHDDPNQEWVRAALHPDGSREELDMAGWTIRNNAGNSFSFPTGFRLQKGLPVTLYSGSGNSDKTALYWNHPTPIWDDTGDCARLFDPTGEAVHAVFVGRDKDRLCDPRRDRASP